MRISRAVSDGLGRLAAVPESPAVIEFRTAWTAWTARTAQARRACALRHGGDKARFQIMALPRLTRVGGWAALPRRGLNREQAAFYVGISPTKFDELVKDGRMPKPKRIDNRRIWDVRAL